MSEEYPEVTTGSIVARQIREEMNRRRASELAAPKGSATTHRYGISEERILTVSNHISEDEPNCFTKEEAIETVKFFRDLFDSTWNLRIGERTHAAVELLRLANEFMRPDKSPNESSSPTRTP